MGRSTAAMSICDLDPDVLFHIVEYIQGSLSDLRSLGHTNQYLHAVVFEGDQVDPLFPCGGKRYWKNLYDFSRLVNEYQMTSPPVRSALWQSVGVLEPDQEHATLAWCHPDLEGAGSEPASGGYFGYSLLPKEVAVWGDYSGIAFLPTVDSLVPGGQENPKPSHSYLFGQALQVMAVDYYNDPASAWEYFFLGFASGDVQCLYVKSASAREGTGAETAKDDMDEYEVSGGTFHSSEVSDLCQVSKRHLLSASMTSCIIIHWNALLDGNLDRVVTIDVNLEVVLSMASYDLLGTDENGGSCVVVGGRHQTVYQIWLPPSITSSVNEDGTPSSVVASQQLARPSVNGNVSFLSFKNDRLILGASLGDVTVSDLKFVGPDMDFLEQRYTIPRCCASGCLESVELVRDILITAGGPSGNVLFWDWDTGCPLGRLRIHPGRTWNSGTSLYTSSVVSVQFIHERSSLICLCRDGYVREWSVVDELKNGKLKRKNSTKRAKKRKRATITSSPACRRTTRSTEDKNKSGNQTAVSPSA